MSSLTFSHTVTERFLRYVTIDTQSDPESPSSPSTEKQKDLGRVLAAELKANGRRGRASRRLRLRLWNDSGQHT
ncbi:di/tripeptidase [Bradyrhizobium sp. GM5.1]